MYSLKRNQKICLKGLLSKDLDDTRVELRREFQCDIFSRLINQYSSETLASKLQVTRSMIYHYRNVRVNNISLGNLKVILSLIKLSERDVVKNIISCYSSQGSVIDIMKEGQRIRHDKLHSYKIHIPTLQQIVEKGYLNLEKWFRSYKKLIDFGSRSFISIKFKGNKLILVYTNYSKGKKKIFTNTLPRKIKIDRDFLYFFGLWLGDKVGEGRFGVANKEPHINEITSHLLKKYYQTPIFDLIISKGQPLPKNAKFDKVVRVKKDFNGYAISVYSVNRIFRSFFKYLESNLSQFFTLIKNEHVIFAGLFDAEGNIFLEDQCYRWSCKNDNLLPIYIHRLRKLRLFRRYDGFNMVGYNKEVFYEKVFPYLQHPKKINNFNIIYNYKGDLERRFEEILNKVYQVPGSTNKQIAKSLKKVKVSSQLKVLERMNLIKKYEYPHKNYITKKGLKYRLVNRRRKK
tara:strand:- start:1495 stop:2871 length:1377 start_codon:yes stop_codon:yes gene_type:complete